MTGGYLEGIRVLDFTQYLAGPACTRLLAEMGADVVKVEQAPHGDPSRANNPRRNNRSGAFVQQNRGKRSVGIDLRHPDGLAVVRALADTVDVVVENFSPGVMARKGLDHATLSATNPRLIMASISGFGQTGALAHKTAFDMVAQAMSGMMHVTGEPDGPPMFMGAAIADCSAGFHAFAAIGYALFRRSITGRGSAVDVSMIDSLFHMHEMAVMAPSLSDGCVRVTRTGRLHSYVSPAGTFRGPQGWIVVIAVPAHIGALFEAMGRPELVEDPRFATLEARLANARELSTLIEEWMAGFEDDDAVISALDAHRVPCGRVLDPAEAHTVPAFLERGLVREVDDPLTGPVRVPGFPLRFSDGGLADGLVAPALGQHNAEVLGELLGYDNARVQQLTEAGALVSKDH